MSNKCSFCGMDVYTRQHHLIPRAKKGKETAPACFCCEDFIHKTWNNNELRDYYNSVDAILATTQFQRFLKWRRNQPADTIFKSDRGQNRDKNKYH